jgi:hypothetical protein
MAIRIYDEPHEPKLLAPWLHGCVLCQSVAVEREGALAHYRDLGHGGSEATCLGHVLEACMEMATVPHVVLFVPRRVFGQLDGVCPRNLRLAGLRSHCVEVRP